MTKRTNRPHPGAVDSSYTFFYLIFSGGVSYLIASAFDSTEVVWAILFLLAIIYYFINDIVRQLFEPNEIIIVWLLTFLVLPAVMTFSFDVNYSGTALAIFIFSLLGAGMAELLYNFLKGTEIAKPTVKRLMGLDAKLDRSMVELSDRFLLQSRFTGLLLTLGIAAAYYTVVYLLLHPVWKDLPL